MENGSELLSPAGDFETALAAFAAGADAVYCGLADFSARAFAKNFSFEELDSLIRYAHAARRDHPSAPSRVAAVSSEAAARVAAASSEAAARVAATRPLNVYVTFNTLLDEDQLEGAIEQLAKLEEVGPDAVIVQDLGVARLVRKFFPKLELHASTQLVAHNLEGVLALKELGFRRIVLARELSLEEITRIARSCGTRNIAEDGRPETELEVFIHGALCYSLSGLCLYGAMEKDRSGNRGRCPYCCRRQIDGKYPFSMKDLRLGEDVRKLVEAGVTSLKIEGRMKSPLYVASVTKYYRDILDGRPAKVTEADLETVFSRRTTELYFNGRGSEPVVDAESLGHRGTPIGKVKKITRDRDGRAWLRFHTYRALEKHDGLQFDALTDEGRHFGFGITEMRQAISRRNVFEVAADEDAEILVPEDAPIHSGDEIYCSMSNAVKRRFPVPSFRPSDYEGTNTVDLEVTLESSRIRVAALNDAFSEVSVEIPCELAAAKSPEKTFAAVERAFSRLGGTAYRFGTLTLNDPDRLFAPASVLNDLRRDFVEALDEARARFREEKIERAKNALGEEVPESMGPGASTCPEEAARGVRSLKIRCGQKIPAGEWEEIIVAVNQETDSSSLPAADNLRLALPVYTGELGFNRLRNVVKRFIREGFTKWEASDLATLRMLRQLGIEDISADWSLYAFNSQALATLTELGARRFVASPENGRENLQYLAESGYRVEFLAQQSTPLFISLHAPAGGIGDLAELKRDGTHVTTRNAPRTFDVPEGASSRVDLSWDPEDAD